MKVRDRAVIRKGIYFRGAAVRAIRPGAHPLLCPSPRALRAARIRILGLLKAKFHVGNVSYPDGIGRRECADRCASVATPGALRRVVERGLVRPRRTTPPRRASRVDPPPAGEGVCCALRRLFLAVGLWVGLAVHAGERRGGGGALVLVLVLLRLFLFLVASHLAFRHGVLRGRGECF